MRVLIVYHYVAKYREAVFSELLCAQDAKFDLASDVKANNDIELAQPDFYVSDRFIRLKNKWFGRGVLWQQGLLKRLLKEKYDVVVFLGDPHFLSSWVALVLVSLLGGKSVLWTHGFIRGSGIKDRIKLIFYQFADAIWLYGDEAKKNLIRHGVKEDKIYPIYNSLDYLKQKKMRTSICKEELFEFKSELFDKERFQIVFVGRLTAQKKLHVLIELVYRLKCSGVEVNLLFVGDGEARKGLELDVEKLGLLDGRVLFYGKTYDEKELCQLIMSSDLCVSPGEVGLTAIHVMGYGVPVVSHNNEFCQMPEYESIIDGVTGRLFEHESLVSLVQVVKDLIENPISNVNEKCIGAIEARYTPEAQKKLMMRALESVAY